MLLLSRIPRLRYTCVHNPQPLNEPAAINGYYSKLKKV